MTFFDMPSLRLSWRRRSSSGPVERLGRSRSDDGGGKADERENNKYVQTQAALHTHLDRHALDVREIPCGPGSRGVTFPICTARSTDTVSQNGPPRTRGRKDRLTYTQP